MNLSLSDFTSTIRNNLLKGTDIQLIDPKVLYERNNEENAPCSNDQSIPNVSIVTLMVVPSGTEVGISSFILGNQSDLENQMPNQSSNIIKNSSILLTVPGKTEKDTAVYRSTLTWELAMVLRIDERASACLLLKLFYRT
ncbi:hypothetical protein HCG82_10390 [Enterococcus faecium]|nr:hypothetical protein [Enterococcus faecium]MBX9128125.1 hypothetical protein [Enterococcus casseliflavus]